VDSPARADREGARIEVPGELPLPVSAKTKKSSPTHGDKTNRLPRYRAMLFTTAHPSGFATRAERIWPRATSSTRGSAAVSALEKGALVLRTLANCADNAVFHAAEGDEKRSRRRGPGQPFVTSGCVIFHFGRAAFSRSTCPPQLLRQRHSAVPAKNRCNRCLTVRYLFPSPGNLRNQRTAAGTQPRPGTPASASLHAPHAATPSGRWPGFSV